MRYTYSRPIAPLVVIFALIVPALSARADAPNTVGWRSDATGAYPAATPPLAWSENSHVVWAADMPGWSNSSPAILPDQGLAFVNAEPFTLLCVDLKTGDIEWRRDNSRLELLDKAKADAIRDKLAASADQLKELRQAEARLSRIRRQLRRNKNDPELLAEQKQRTARVSELKTELADIADYRLPSAHNANGYSTPTPVTDGQHVFALFGNGIAAAYDLRGDRKWITAAGQPSHKWGLSASPLLIDGVLVLQLGDLVGLDAATGEELWRTPSQRSFGSPIRIDIPAKSADSRTITAVVSCGGLVVDPKTGDTLADLGDTLTYCAPVWKDGVLYFIESDAAAYRVTHHDGSVATETLWKTRIDGDRHYASPVVHDGLIYTVTRGETMTVMEADTGKTVYTKDLRLDGPKPNSAYPSPTLAGDRLYLGSQNGTTLVLATGREYKELARNSLDGHRSSPVFLGDKMYLRGFNKLWCISTK